MPMDDMGAEMMMNIVQRIRRLIQSRYWHGVSSGLLIVLLIAGCTSSAPRPLPRNIRRYSQPTVAVLSFENKARFPYDWNIGSGVRDLLVDALVASQRFNVVSRGELGAVMGEIDIQRDPHFRDHGRVAYGNLKNVQYLIKGAVTEFNHVAGAGGWAKVKSLGIGGRGSEAVVAVTLYVIEVESGQVVASESLEGRAVAGNVDVIGFYKNVVFGGDAFYKTPLGRATRDVMGRIIESLSYHIARSKWQPRIAKVNEDMVYISGGVDRKLSANTLWVVFANGTPILDPATGDVLGHEPGRRKGVVRIVAVYEKFSQARILQGMPEVGDCLLPYNDAEAAELQPYKP